MIPRERARFFGIRRLRWSTLRFVDALVLSVPLWLLLVYLVGAPLARYLDARVFSDWWTRTESLDRLAAGQLSALAHLPAALRLRMQLDAEAPDPSWIRLHVERDRFRAWQGRPLALHREWIPAQLWQGRDLHEVKLRKRGDTSVHWITPKKSFTLKTRRGSLYKGHRRLAFSGKTPLEQVVVGQLARDYGLLAPDTFLAPVFVNDRFYGLFRATELIDESLLRRLGRMPGDIFRGDTAERGENFRGVDRSLWHSPALWDRVARNDRPTRPATSGLERLLRGIAGSDAAGLRLREQLLDREELARLLAFLLVAGDPYHMTNLHNQFWYEDPSSGRLHPVVWDIRLRPLHAEPDQPLNAAFGALLRDPRLMDEVLTELARREAEGTLLGHTAGRLADIEARLADPLAFEALRRGLVPGIAEPAQVSARLKANRQVLAGWLRAARIALHAAPAAGDPGWQVIDLRVHGRAAVSWLGLDEAVGDLQVVADRNRNGRRDPGDRVVAIDGSGTLAEPERLLPGVDTSSWRIAASPLHYRFFVRGGGTPRFENALTGEPVVAGPLQTGTPLVDGPGLHPWDPLPTESRRIRLAGELALDETLRLAEGDTLEIAPGSVLRLGPEVSIFSRGQVRAVGTEQSPIRIEAQDPRRPWGAFALLGPGASGSRFAHVQFRGGGGAELDAVEFKGMVDVHWAENVHFVGCLFADNLRSDDAFNAVHAEVALVGNDFERANADAVDYDYSRGRIEGNRFEASGNDAIDLMTSNPRIVGNRISGSGDKGISVGEASEPWIQGNEIRGCQTGIEIKDRSEPWMVDNRLEGNALGLHQKAKNWRYGAGGRGKWIGPPLTGNAEELRSDDRSQLSRHAATAPPLWATSPSFRPLRFPDGFGMPAPWELLGERTRLLRRRGDLVMQPRREEGGARLLLRAPAPGWLVVEYRADRLEGGTLGWHPAGEPSRVEIGRPAPGGEYELAALPVEAAGEGHLTLRARPGVAERGAGPAELRVRSLRFVDGS